MKAGFFFLIFLLLLPGCASRWQMEGLRKQVDSLERSNLRLEDRAAQLDSLLRAQTEMTNRLGADLSSTLGGMDERMGIVESKLEDLGHRFPELYQKIDLVKQQVAKKDTAGISDTTKTVIDVDPKQLYDAAYLDLTKGEYDLAITGFSNYLKYFPETELSDDAQYWLGECYYAKKNYTKAAIGFHEVLENYSTGDKVPSALYKLGLSLLELKSVGQANKYFQELVDKYPHTQEAKLAKEKLEKPKG
jgi:tol-pal system protein YbgF